MTSSLYHDDGDIRLHHGNVIDVLRTMPDRSVHMVASSPPFWGLRDYGTARWDGGNADCDHAERELRRGVNLAASAHSTRGGAIKAAEVGWLQYRDVCGKCGAIRTDQQIGLEDTPDAWVARLVDVYRECRRVLRDDGVMWVEIGDSYCSTAPGTRNTPDMIAGSGADERGVMRPNTPPGMKPKDLVGQPWLLAFALRADGWYLRSEIIWHKPNPMPESTSDRPTKGHSTVFLLSKRPRYFYDAQAIAEPAQDWTRGGPGTGIQTTEHYGADNGGNDGLASIAQRYKNGDAPPTRNARSVWQIATENYSEAHFATWPQALVERMIKAGTSEHGCCAVCGAPWQRITDRATIERHELDRDDPRYRAARYDATHDASPYAANSPQRYAQTTTRGWEPTCLHHRNNGLRPCVVLDPFVGSGTTALVARRLGRHAIGIDLNREYLDLAKRRIGQPTLWSTPA